MKKSRKFLRNLGKVSSYIFGVGVDDYFIEYRHFIREFKGGTSREKELDKMGRDRFSDAVCKNTGNLFEVMFFSFLLEKNYNAIYGILFLELYRLVVHKIYRSKRKLRRLKDAERKSPLHGHQTLEEIGEEHDRALERRPYRGD